MNQRIGSLACALAIAAVALAHEASAQPLGAFYWQLQPFCNVIALHITQYVTPPGAVYALTGFDDQCGATTRATLAGTATLNHDGSIGVGLTIVTAPGGTPVHVDARVALASLSGPWADSVGNAGIFVPLPPSAGDRLRDGAAGPTAGPARPVPPNGIAPGTITTTQLAPGVIGGAQIDPNQVQTRVAATCAVGQYLRGINPNGTVICEPLLTLNVSNRVDAPSNRVGQYTSIAIGADGVPVISHYNETIRALRVTYCGNAACAAGVHSWTVGNGGFDVGQYTSIAIGAHGFPVISQWDSLFALRVTYCRNADCTYQTSTRIDDTDHSVGQYTSIAIGVDELPVISHWDATVGKLRVTHCGNAECTDRTSTTIDDTDHNVGQYTSIAIGVDGLPVISHWDATALALRVTHCGNAACTAGNVSTVVDDPADSVGQYTSIVIGADGLPVISHWDQAAQALRLTHCGNVACTADNDSTTVDDPTDNVGQYTSVALGTDGLPVIGHWNASRHALRVTHCGNASCTAGNVSATVDNRANEVDGYISLAIGADGLPVISYWDERTFGLGVTKCATRTCQ